MKTPLFRLQYELNDDIPYSEAPRRSDGNFRRPPRRNSQD